MMSDTAAILDTPVQPNLPPSYDGPMAVTADLKLGEHFGNTWVYMARTALGRSLKMVLHPHYWALLTDRMRVNDMLIVLADDASFEYWGRVTNVGKREVFFRQLFIWGSDDEAIKDVPLQTEPANTPIGSYTTMYRGARKWCVLSPSGEVISDFHLTKPAAQDWLRQYQQGHVKPKVFGG